MPTAPELPAESYELTAEGFRIGHASDAAARTGVTVVLCPEGATAAADVRGTATGTRQFDSLRRSHHLAHQAHAVVLSGGSSFGLAAADPVVAHLEAGGHGFRTGSGVVPLVPTAILFDLAFAEPGVRPHQRLATEALAGAVAAPFGSRVASGSVGAGTGATVGKAKGLDCAMKGGFGFVSMTVPGGPTVAAAVAVNAFGDIRDPDSGRLVAGCRDEPAGRELVGADRVLVAQAPSASHPWEGNTTLAVVMTDAELTKSNCRKVCEMAFGGLYRAVLPALSLYDGDLVVTLASGKHRAHVHQIGVLAERVVARAILRAVVEADGFGRVPAVRDLAGGV